MTAPDTRRVLVLEADGTPPRELAQAQFKLDPSWDEITIVKVITPRASRWPAHLRRYSYVMRKGRIERK